MATRHKTIADLEADIAFNRSVIEKGQGVFGKNREINQAETNIQNLEAQRPDLEGREELKGLVTSERERGQQLLEQQTEQRKTRRGELAGLLTEQQERIFSEESPEILESLSGRGLLHSSAVGEEFARSKEQLAGRSAEILAMQGLQDVDVEQDFARNLLSREFGLEESGVQRSFSTADRSRQEALARELAGIQSSSIEKQGQLQGLGTVAGFGLSALSR